MSARIFAPGIYLDMTATDYFADPCPEPSLTQSIVKVLLERSPAHARLEHPRLAPPLADDPEEEKYNKVQAIGTAAHAELIGRGKELEVCDFDSWRSGDSKKARDAAIAAGKTPILTEHHGIACAMVEAALEQLHGTEHELAFHPDHGDGEVVLAWQEGETWLRTMLDWKMRPVPRYYDYKTTGLSCAPHVVEDRPSELGWDVQAAMHQRALDVLDPGNIGRCEFFYVNQENEPPFALSIIRISEADLTLGRKKIEAGLSIWRACMSAKHWPLYPIETVLSHPRGYTEARWLEREVAMESRPVLARRPRPERMLTDLSGG